MVIETSGCFNHSDSPVLVPVLGTKKESEDTYSVFFPRLSWDARPGQFVMVWVPGDGEEAFFVTYEDSQKWAITFKNNSEVAKKLAGLKPNTLVGRVGVRGPYGNPFTLVKDEVVVLGEGLHAATAAFLARDLKRVGANVTLIIGAQSRCNLIFLEWVKQWGLKVCVTTEDGSLGLRGDPSTAFAGMLLSSPVNRVYAAGNDVLLKNALLIANQYSLGGEFLMERKMPCGLGLCGGCCVDFEGLRLCKEGPVLKKEHLNRVFELDRYCHSPSGKREEYYTDQFGLLPCPSKKGTVQK